MQTHLEEEQVAVVYVDHFREYGIRILDGGCSIQMIEHCPWCGSKLPSSLRKAWFEKLDLLGLEPGDERIPEEMKSDQWWRKPRES